MNIACIQADIEWENPSANLTHFEELIQKIVPGCDLLILPEMFTTGFTMRSEAACLPPENFVVEWMKKQAFHLNAAITGSLIIRDNNDIYNRLYFVEPEGKISIYDKRHLFRMGGESEHFRAGSKRLIIPFRGWNILPLICYDLRFPVWSRNQEDYDLLIYLANWPGIRSDVWNTLLRARAIENQAWVAGVNRVGKDGEEIDYIGESQFVDPKGRIVSKLNDKESVLQESISLEELQNFRKKFPAWKDRDSFILL